MTLLPSRCYCVLHSGFAPCVVHAVAGGLDLCDASVLYLGFIKCHV